MYKRQALKGVGLTLGKVTEVESDKPKGIVVGQDPASGTEVDAGTIVNIEVSKGPKEPVKVSFSIPLPTQIDDSVNLTIYIDGTEKVNKNVLPSKAKSEQMTISGLESDMPVTVTVKIDGKNYQEYKVNFATGKAELVPGSDHSGDFKPTPPTSSSQSAAQGGNAGGEVKG